MKVDDSKSNAAQTASFNIALHSSYTTNLAPQVGCTSLLLNDYCFIWDNPCSFLSLCLCLDSSALLIEWHRLHKLCKLSSSKGSPPCANGIMWSTWVAGFALGGLRFKQTWHSGCLSNCAGLVLSLHCLLFRILSTSPLVLYVGGE